LTKTDKEGTFLLHFLPHSLISYAVTYPSTASSSAPNPGSRAVSSTNPSPNSSSTFLSDAKKSLRRNKSLQSLNEASKEKETTFAKFLAARRPQNAQKEAVEEKAAGIGEGREVERDGYGEWSAVKVSSNGDGIGIGQETVDVFWCNGRRLEVRGQVKIGARIDSALYGVEQGAVCVKTKVSTFRAMT
jgi:hypothetical protein